MKIELRTDGFTLLDFIDCASKHHEPNDRFQWGIEQALKMDLSPYYYFSVNKQNFDKKVLPGKAYVNGMETENIEGLDRGEYLIKKEFVKEPFVIQIEGIPALIVNVLDFNYSKHLAPPNKRTIVTIFDPKFLDLIEEKVPEFIVYKANTKEEIKLEEFEYATYSYAPKLKFKMPNFDIDIKVIFK